VDETVAGLHFWLYTKNPTSADTWTELESSECSEENFNNWSLETASAVSGYTCLDDKTVEIVSNSAKTTSEMSKQYLVISVDKCLGSNCRNSSEIDLAIQGGSIQLITIESYHDVKKEDNPIRHYLNNRYSVPISNLFSTEAKLDLVPNIVKFLDESVDHYYTTKMVQTGYYDSSSNTLAMLYIDTSLEYNVYDQAQVFYAHWVFIITQIGGILFLLYIVGYILTLCLTRNKLKQSYAARIKYMEEILGVKEEAPEPKPRVGQNVDEEEEERKFDDNGNFIRRKDISMAGYNKINPFGKYESIDFVNNSQHIPHDEL
jgi:hypothetical protein